MLEFGLRRPHATMDVTRATKVGISLLWFLGDQVVQLALRLGSREGMTRFVVLYYHGVPAASRKNFARQMDLLARKARVVRAGEELSPGHSGWCVAITFDDAFCSVSEHAVPEMVLRSLPSTIFVPASFLGDAPGWATELSAPGSASERVMDAQQLKALPSLVELGSHTLSHPHLPKLEEGQLHEEIGGSRDRLAAVLDRDVPLLAFPYGEYDQRTVEACRAAGYRRVFSIAPHLADPAGLDFVRGRVAVDPQEGRLSFYLKAKGAYRWMVQASALKRRLLHR